MSSMSGLGVNAINEIKIDSCATPQQQQINQGRPLLVIKGLSSFAWVAGRRDEIMVPGLPLELSSPAWPLSMPIETEMAHTSQHPQVFEAVLRSIIKSQPLSSARKPSLGSYVYNPPERAIAEANIVATHSDLGPLFKVAMRKSVWSFRIDVEVQDRTVLLAYWQDPAQSITPDMGRGIVFREAVTKAVDGFHDIEEQQHVVSWCFGSIKAIMAFPVDAFSCELEDDGHSHPMQSKTASGTAYPPWKVPSVKVVHKGRHIPVSCLVQIHAYNRNDDDSNLLPDLWLTGIRRVYLGRYDKTAGDPEARISNTGEIPLTAVFDEDSVILEDYSEGVRNWEGENRAGLALFDGLLAAIVTELLKTKAQTGGNRYALVYDALKPSTIQLYPRTDGRDMVSETTAGRIWG